MSKKDPMADVKRAKRAFDAVRAGHEARGQEVLLLVVGYATGREPFRLGSRVSADMGVDTMPEPPITVAEMQSVAFAAKMALARVLRARSKVRCGR